MLSYENKSAMKRLVLDKIATVCVLLHSISTSKSIIVLLWAYSMTIEYSEYEFLRCTVVIDL